jgi:phosphate uptake regulator
MGLYDVNKKVQHKTITIDYLPANIIAKGNRKRTKEYLRTYSDTRAVVSPIKIPKDTDILEATDANIQKMPNEQFAKTVVEPQP